MDPPVVRCTHAGTCCCCRADTHTNLSHQCHVQTNARTSHSHGGTDSQSSTWLDTLNAHHEPFKHGWANWGKHDWCCPMIIFCKEIDSKISEIYCDHNEITTCRLFCNYRRFTEKINICLLNNTYRNTAWIIHIKTRHE